MRGLRRFVLSGVLVCSCFAIGAVAQTAPAPLPSQEDRIKALEERIIALEGQVRMLKAAPAPAEAAAQPAAMAPVQPAPAPAEAGGQLPVYGGATAMAKALNPDISVIGDFLMAAGHQPTIADRFTGLSPFPVVPAFQMHESEIGLQAIVDPYARADFFISFGEQGVNLEEGYITFTALPAGLVLRGGKMRAAFGKVNTLHNHVLPWTDRPMVTDSLVAGEDGINDAGLSLTRIFAGPKGLFLEGTGQVFRGDTETLFAANRRTDLSVVGHLRAYRDLTESTNLDVGISYARGHNDLGSNFLTNLYGMDATLRWKPLRRSIYHSFIGRSELIWSDHEGVPARFATASLPATQQAFGYYASADYQFGRRWFIGGRYDQSQRARDAALTDRGGSLVLTYWPSEFSQLRWQYRVAHYAEGKDSNELRLQLQFSLGAHGAHPF